MEAGLLAKESCGGGGSRWREIGKEMKRLGYLAGPMMAVTLSFFLLQVISLMMVGHLGELSLSSSAIAFSLASVTGFSFHLGMASALETISGQAFGAKQYEKIGIQNQTAIFSLIIISIPISILWTQMSKVLVLVGQDPEISHETGRFMTWLIPALFGYATLQPLIRYYQMQSLVLPMLLSSTVTLCFHIPVCWTLVFKTSLENLGGAVAVGISMWLNVTILGTYMLFSPTCAKTRAPISIRMMFQGMGEFFRFAVPSAVMICLEWWSFELVILLSGILPNPQLETSVLSVCLNTIATLYAIPYGLSAAASTRISNELGAGRPEGARLSVIALMLLAAIDAIVASASLFASRHVFGYIFSNEAEVVEYVTNLAPLICLSVIMDSIQGPLSGVARGCGWQHLGAYVNLSAFYLFGIPIAGVLGFWLNFRGKGLWVGILCGATLQTIMLSIITACTNWEKQHSTLKLDAIGFALNKATKARERLFGLE
ncbi:MATE efflux family protein [Striga asiatica]|uniref:Protein DETOXIFICATION n=1 Tax=Striga asiatica TaxID=4170 RepID=A0A5A7QGI1_STRAF|nr:MATE efflux family protein [Striga asiatica]